MSEIEIKSIVPKADRPFLSGPRAGVAHDSKQRKLMLGSLCLLLFALSVVLWHERDFWFPESPEAESDQPADTTTVVKVASQPGATVAKANSVAKPKHQVAAQAKPPAPPSPSA